MSFYFCVLLLGEHRDLIHCSTAFIWNRCLVTDLPVLFQHPPTKGQPAFHLCNLSQHGWSHDEFPIFNRNSIPLMSLKSQSSNETYHYVWLILISENLLTQQILSKICVNNSLEKISWSERCTKSVRAKHDPLSPVSCEHLHDTSISPRTHAQAAVNAASTENNLRANSTSHVHLLC